MNRKARRAAERRGQNALPKPDERAAGANALARLFEVAVRQHQAGEFGPAEAIYRQILAADPGHSGSLHLLGLIAHRAGDNERAAELIGRAIGHNRREPNYHYNMALVLRALGRSDQAIEHARQAIILDPDHFGSHVALTDLHAAQGDSDAAVEHCRRAIAIDPSHYAPHVTLGDLRRGQSRFEEALDCYVRAIEAAPDHMDAHHGLCSSLMAQGQFAAAASHYQAVLDYRSDDPVVYISLAIALLGAGKTAQAFDAAVQALRLADIADARPIFIQCLRGLSAVPVTDEVRRFIVLAMSQPWGRPGELTRACARLILADPEIAGCVERAHKAWPRRLDAIELYGSSGLRALAGDAVLRALLENARNDNLAIEHCLTSARQALLDAAFAEPPEGSVDEETLGFYSALARQCFINEYVFALTPEEVLRTDALHAEVTVALRAGTPVAALRLAALAAYAPLGDLPEPSLLLGRQWPGPIEALITQQVREPAEESRLRGTIAQLTPIEDDISGLVQRQYEENPYPRWVKAAPAGRAIPITTRLRGHFPFSALRDVTFDQRPEVLVAGCGTGQQLVDVAQRIAGACVLAVDLSLTSLSYAKRKTNELGLANIEYGRADILELGTLGREFDIVDCGGVLHHLGDPLEGWRRLVALLRPGGLMRIALYSEAARRHVVAARDLVAAGGYERTAEDIRRFRQDVLARPDGDLVKTIAQSPDFYSISDLRDLAFHVQEHRFTLPEIAAFLDANGLVFLGFEADLATLNRYSARFPQDRARVNLDHWDAFERDNPRTFAGMYQFWAQRRAA